MSEGFKKGGFAKLRILFCIFAGFLIAPAAFGQAAVNFSFGDFTARPSLVRTFVLYPTAVSATNAAGQIVTVDRFSTNTGLSGSLTVSNLLAGGYRSEISAPGFTTTTNFFNFPATNGLLNAKDWLALPTNQVAAASAVAYSQAQSDGRFVQSTGGKGTNLVLSGQFNGTFFGIAANASFAPFMGSQINFFGDSQTSDSLNTSGTPNAVGATSWTSWPNMLTNDPISFGITNYKNYAVSGADITNLQTQVGSIQRGNTTWNFEWEGVNDCPALASTNLTAWTVMKSNIWQSLLSSNGDRLVVFTLPAIGTSYASYNASTSQVARASINRWTVGEVTRLSTLFSNRVFLVDLASTFTDPIDPCFWDTLHLNDNGRRILVSTVKRAVSVAEFASYRGQNPWRTTTNTVYFPAELGTVGVGAIPQSPGNVGMEIYKATGEALRLRADSGYISLFTAGGVRNGYLQGYNANMILASDAGGISLNGTNVAANGNISAPTATFAAMTISSNNFPNLGARFANLGNGGAVLWNSNGVHGYWIWTNVLAGTAGTNQAW